MDEFELGPFPLGPRRLRPGGGVRPVDRRPVPSDEPVAWDDVAIGEDVVTWDDEAALVRKATGSTRLGRSGHLWLRCL